ncbi:uncharacterized protein LOC107042764 [Diachasma alloeum]|uniref:uncharacterized protein LOC107042764 n=1 Tax=Diachasma alloeum TaxID=454923 RepID=UPI00073811A8|nr:uncharacterized protein LOC107042764 [Diachasma alloeum]
MIFKKGDRDDPGNYRGIALVNTGTKLFNEILRKRLEKWAETNNILPESQHGFRRGRSCTDAIFCLLSAIHLQLRLPKREVYAIFVNFKRAFDSIPHTKVWQTLQVIRAFFRAKEHVGLNIDGRTDILMQLFADDTVLLTDSPVKLKSLLNILADYCAENGLTVNASKSKIMTFKAAGRPKYLDTRFTMYDGTPLEMVYSYAYLGVLISGIARSNIPMNAAFGKARSATASTLSIIFRSHCDNWSSYLKLFDSSVSSTLLYAIPAWDIRCLGEIEVNTHSYSFSFTNGSLKKLRYQTSTS